MGRGRVKRRSPPIIGQFTVVAWASEWRRLRITRAKSNRIAHFRWGNDFSHGLGHEEQFPPTRLSAGYGFRKETLAGARRNGRDAPFAGVRWAYNTTG